MEQRHTRRRPTILTTPFWLGLIKDVSSASLLTAGLLYVLGLFVANIGLYQDCHQIWFVPLLRLRYLLVGFSALVYVAFVLFPFACWWLATQYGYQTIRSTLAQSLLLISAMLIPIVPACAYFLWIGEFTGSADNFMVGYVYSAVTASSLVIMLRGVRPSRSRSLRHARTAGTALLIVGTIASLLLYSTTIYSHLSSAIGGGKTVLVRCLLSPQARNALSQGSVKVSKDGWTDILTLRDETEDCYVFQTQEIRLSRDPQDSDRVFPALIAIKKTLVQSVYYVPRVDARHILHFHYGSEDADHRRRILTVPGQ